MKVLLLVQQRQRVNLDRLYAGIAAECDCDIRWLTDEQQADLRGYFREHVEHEAYQRVVLFLRFKKEIRQVRFIRTLPNLVILEHDAYQNYIPGKYAGVFSNHYRQLPWARVISSGAVVTRRLCAEGVDAVFVPKGYDAHMLKAPADQTALRDIELAFLGSLRNETYAASRALIESLAEVENLLVQRTESGEDYRQTLRRIRFFVSADVGMGEYMIKNFEAMACGCLLFAFDQGEEENRALGFVDGVNVVLYRGLDELRSKLHHMRENPAIAECIADNGTLLVEQHFEFFHLGGAIVAAMRAPLRARPQARWWDAIGQRLWWPGTRAFRLLRRGRNDAL